MLLSENCGYRLTIENAKATVTWKIEPNNSYWDFSMPTVTKYGTFRCGEIIKWNELKTLAFRQWAEFDQDLSVEVSPSKTGRYALTRIASEWLEKLKKSWDK